MASASLIVFASSGYFYYRRYIRSKQVTNLRKLGISWEERTSTSNSNSKEEDSKKNAIVGSLRKGKTDKKSRKAHLDDFNLYSYEKNENNSSSDSSPIDDLTIYSVVSKASKTSSMHPIGMDEYSQQVIQILNDRFIKNLSLRKSIGVEGYPRSKFDLLVTHASTGSMTGIKQVRRQSEFFRQENIKLSDILSKCDKVGSINFGEMLLGSSSSSSKYKNKRRFTIHEEPDS